MSPEKLTGPFIEYMECDTTPRFGDTDNNLLFKIAMYYSELCPAANAAPRCGDTDNNLLFKIAKSLSICGGCGSPAACSDPAAPSDLAATQPDPLTFISWTDNATNETSYEIRYQNLTQGGGFNSEPPLPANSVGATVIIGSPSPQDLDQIEIQVRAVNGSCVSEWVSITVIATIFN